MVSEVFPADAFDAVSGDGIADSLGNGDPQSWAPIQAGKNDSDETPGVDSLAVPGQSKKIMPMAQSKVFPKTIPPAVMGPPAPLSILRIHALNHPLH